MNRLYQDYNWLKTEYVDKKRSLRDIAKECGVSNSTIHRWVHKFGFKPHSRCKELPSKAFEPSFELGYILGVLCGDGCLSYNKSNNNWRIILRTSSKKFAEFFKDILKKWGNLTLRIPEAPTLSRSIIDGREVISWQYYCYVDSKEAFKLLKKLLGDKSKIPEICLQDKSCLYGFISGFFDSEGAIYETDVRGWKQKVVVMGVTNRPLLAEIKKALKSLGFHPTSTYHRVIKGRKPFDYFRLTRREEVLRFMDEVHNGFKALPRDESGNLVD